MTDQYKKLLSAGLATLMALTASLVQGDVVPPEFIKLTLWTTTALGIINTTFMPALFGPLPPHSPLTKSADIAARRLPIILLLGLSASCANLDPKVVAATASIATVKGIGDGVEVYTKLANAKEDVIADAVIATCKGEATPAGYKSCTDREAALRREPWDKADKAIGVYKEALEAGGAALGKRWFDIVKNLIEALAVLNIRVLPGGSL